MSKYRTDCGWVSRMEHTQQAASCGHSEVWQLPVVLWAGPPEDMDLISCASTPLGPPALPMCPSLCLIHLGLATTQAQGPQTPRALHLGPQIASPLLSPKSSPLPAATPGQGPRLGI